MKVRQLTADLYRRHHSHLSKRVSCFHLDENVKETVQSFCPYVSMSPNGPPANLRACRAHSCPLSLHRDM